MPPIRNPFFVYHATSPFTGEDVFCVRLHSVAMYLEEGEVSGQIRTIREMYECYGQIAVPVPCPPRGEKGQPLTQQEALKVGIEMPKPGELERILSYAEMILA